jgi:hypothetical protein
MLAKLASEGEDVEKTSGNNSDPPLFKDCREIHSLLSALAPSLQRA